MNERTYTLDAHAHRTAEAVLEYNANFRTMDPTSNSTSVQRAYHYVSPADHTCNGYNFTKCYLNSPTQPFPPCRVPMVSYLRTNKNPMR